MSKLTKAIIGIAAICFAVTPLEGMHNLYQVEGSPFTTFVAREPGDILTVIIKEKTQTMDNGQQLLQKRDQAAFTLSQFFTSPFNPFNGLTKLAGEGDPLNIDYETDSNHQAIANNTSQRDLKSTIQVRLIEEVSEGQFVIRGHKVVCLNGKDQTVFISGVIRQIDITNANTIFSDQIADAQIQIDGQVANEDTSPGFFMKLFNWVF